MSRTTLEAGPKLQARAAAERSARRHGLLRRAGLGLAVGGALLLLGWLLLASPVLALQGFVVKGQSRLTAAEVTEAARVAPGTPLAKVDTAAVARRLERLAPVARAEVTRAWPHTLRITIVERVPVVALEGGGGFGLLDATGVQVARSATPPPGLFRLRSGSEEATASALAVLRGLPRDLTGRLGVLRAPTAEQVTLVLRDHRTILWGGPSDAALKASAARALLRLPGTVYDVSAPGVVSRR